jgi:C-terminal processing protease CtpA/Prc
MNKRWNTIIAVIFLLILLLGGLFYQRMHMPSTAERGGKGFSTQASDYPVIEHVVGVGIALGAVNNAMIILKVLPNTPAAKAGLTAGLNVQKIDDILTDGKHLKECVDLLRGTVGSKVKLELIDTANGTTNTVELTREQIM